MRKERARSALRVTPVNDVQPVFVGVAERALVGDEAKRRNVTPRTHFADEVVPVSGDRVQLQQVVLNLVMNAIEAMSSVRERPRLLVISTRNIDTDQVQVTVEDSGNGLDPNTMSRIL